jgi:hypothetical protein
MLQFLAEHLVERIDIRRTGGDVGETRVGLHNVRFADSLEKAAPLAIVVGKHCNEAVLGLIRATMLRQGTRVAKLRWRIERDYQELKQELGLGHYEGRGWRGFHHHATLAIAAYGFLLSERATIPPSGPRRQAPIQAPPLPRGYRSRGSPHSP